MLMKYFLIFLLGFTALKLQAQTPAHYLFSAAIQQAADRDSNAWQLQNYAIKFSTTAGRTGWFTIRSGNVILFLT